MSQPCTIDLIGEMNNRIHRGLGSPWSVSLNMSIDSVDVDWLRKQYADSKLTMQVAHHLRYRLGWAPCPA